MLNKISTSVTVRN